MRETNINDWYIELYENFTYDNKEQLNKQEGEVIRKKSSLNKRIEGRTKAEYREDNRDIINEKKKEYNKIHKDKRKAYREAHKDKIKEYNKG